MSDRRSPLVSGPGPTSGTPQVGVAVGVDTDHGVEEFCQHGHRPDSFVGSGLGRWSATAGHAMRADDPAAKSAMASQRAALLVVPGTTREDSDHDAVAAICS